MISDRKAERDERISTRCHNGEHAQCWGALWIAALDTMPPCECDCHTPCAPAACPPVEEIVVTGFTRVFDCGHAHGSPTAEAIPDRCPTCGTQP